MTAIIRRAEEADVSIITELAHKLALDADDADPSEGGFLVSGFSEAKYSKFVANAEHFYVCVDNDMITGFLLAYQPQLIDSKNTVESLLKYIVTDDFVLIKQIAVDPDYQQTGVGTRLYQFLIEQVPNTALLAAIVLAPLNPASIRFHQRFEFKLLLNIEADDGRPRGIWHRPKQHHENAHDFLRVGIVDETSTVDRLQYQCEMATQLYCHEDNLNWSKVGRLLTLIVLLGAAFSFFWQSLPAPEDAFPVWGLLFIGLIVHGIFIVSIVSGLSYMMARKNCVIQLEHRIAALDPNMIPLVSSTKGLSVTARLLYAFPFLSLLTWCVGAFRILSRIYT